MSDEEELVAFGSPESESEIPVAVPDAANDEILDELMRSQSRKRLDLLSNIEEHALSLEQYLAEKAETFLQEKVKAAYKDLFMFHRLALAEQGLSNPQIALMEIGDMPAACVAMERDTVRRILSIALVGSEMPEDEGKPLSRAETGLYLLFADYISTALYEVFPAISEAGILNKSKHVPRERLVELSTEEDWICFSFSLPVKGATETMMFMMPMAMLDPSAPGSGDDLLDDPYDIDPAWRGALFDRIETLPMPMHVELASMELSLSELDTLVPGQTLELPINPEELRVLAEHGTFLLNGALEIQDGQLNLRVLEAAG